MKRMVVLIAGLATLATGLYLATLLRAQPGATPAPAAAPAPQTKIALVNLNQVIKGYLKTTDFQKQFKDLYTSYENQILGMTKDLENKQKAYRESTTVQTQKDQIEADIKRLTRDIQDKKEEAQKKLSEKELDQMRILYQDVETMVGLMAKSRGIELVMHYNDAFTEADKHNPANIQRKLTQMTCMPLYAVPGIDISEEVTKFLNWNVQKNQPATGTQAPTGGMPKN